MFGFSQKEKVTKLILDICEQDRSLFKKMIIDGIKQMGESPKKEKNENNLIKARKIYLDQVAADVEKELRKNNPDASIIYRHALENPEVLGFSKNDFSLGYVAGVVYAAAMYGLTRRSGADMSYCVRMNHLQQQYIDKAITEAEFELEVEKGDQYHHLKRKRDKDPQTLLDGAKAIMDFMYKDGLFSNGFEDPEKSKVIGLCAYLIASWESIASPEIAREVCRLYGNEFQLYSKPIEYANEMLDIVNDAYKQIRVITESLEVTTQTVSELVSAQAKKFVIINGLPVTDNSIAIVEQNIYYYINQYLQSWEGGSDEWNDRELGNGEIDDLGDSEIEKMRNGGTIKVSIAQVANCIVNLSDAKQNLEEKEYELLLSKLSELGRENDVHEVSWESYHELCNAIYDDLEIAGPWELFCGDPNLVPNGWTRREIMKRRILENLNMRSSCTDKITEPIRQQSEYLRVREFFVYSIFFYQRGTELLASTLEYKTILRRVFADAHILYHKKIEALEMKNYFDDEEEMHRFFGECKGRMDQVWERTLERHTVDSKESLNAFLKDYSREFLILSGVRNDVLSTETELAFCYFLVVEEHDWFC